MNSIKIQILMTLTILLQTAAQGASLTQPELNIGVVRPSSESLRPYQREIEKGAEVAIETKNAQYPKLRSKINLFYLKIKGTQQGDHRAMQKFLEKNNINLLFGGIINSEANYIRSIIGDEKVPLISPAPQPSIKKDNTFYSCLAVGPEGAIISKYAYEMLEKRKAIIISANEDPEEKDIVTAFEKDFHHRGGKTIAHYDHNKMPAKIIAQSIASESPDMILLPSHYKKAYSIIKVLREKRILAPIFGTNKWHGRSFYNAKTNRIMSGNYFTTFFTSDDPDPVVKQFKTSFLSKYKTNPSTLSAIGFDTISMAISSFQRADSSLLKPITKALRNSRCTGFSSIKMTKNQLLKKAVPIMTTTARGPVFVTRMQL